MMTFEQLFGLGDAPIEHIVDDVVKYTASTQYDQPTPSASFNNFQLASPTFTTTSSPASLGSISDQWTPNSDFS
ncbi:hypothetical protein HDU96_002661, partial [Phlyctochytrium bullatum]